MTTSNKKKYPTKTITARVPAEDYWTFKSLLVQRRITFKEWLQEQIAIQGHSPDHIGGRRETQGQPCARHEIQLTVTARVPEEDYWTLKQVLIEGRTTLQDWILGRMQSAGAPRASERLGESHRCGA
jgi:hypothetical protein